MKTASTLKKKKKATHGGVRPQPQYSGGEQVKVESKANLG